MDQQEKLKINAELTKKVTEGVEIYRVNTPFSLIRVIQNGSSRYMIFGKDGDSSLQGGIDIMSHRDFVLPYYESAVDVIGKIPRSGRALCIGLGVGVIPSEIKYCTGCQIEVVDIDQEVYNVARNYFDFPDDIKVHINDGFNFVMNSTDKYDLIFVDAYKGKQIPFQMVTVEFFEKCKSLLVEGGTCAMNLSVTHHYYAHHLKTFTEVFGDEVYLNEKMYNAVVYNDRKHPIRDKNVGFTTRKIKNDELSKISKPFSLASV